MLAINNDTVMHIIIEIYAWYSQTMSIEPIERRINWTQLMQLNDCDSIVERNRNSIEYYPGFAVGLSNVIESIEYYTANFSSIDSILRS